MDEAFYSKLEQNFSRSLGDMKLPEAAIDQIIDKMKNAIIVTAREYNYDVINALTEHLQEAGVRSVSRSGTYRIMSIVRGTTSMERAEAIAKIYGIDSSEEFDRFFAVLQKVIADVPGNFCDIPLQNILELLKPYGWKVVGDAG